MILSSGCRRVKDWGQSGEIGVLCYKPQLFQVRTKILNQLLRLIRLAFLNIVQANVGDGTTIMNNLLQHLKDMNDLSNARSSDGDRTCWLMHIAAAKGSENCVVLLLDYGADPNSRDMQKTKEYYSTSLKLRDYKLQ
ncbi:hypothetical protein MKW98_004601 [Papaver atlanticum]|uniref:Uncharacterized protein n=1 Tax=Papaver atlanticum TaxID=357466 RepID=A0AAD4SQD0_9MAGN|nr:hypothetical protein MKW98_004601 [Papaver atlanticum]